PSLDLLLRRDAGVVGAGDPLRPLPARPMKTDEHVLDRAVERMAHVQRAGDVRRRHRDRVILPRVTLWLGVNEDGVEPALDDARIHLRSVVSGLGLTRGHEAL